MKIDDQVESQVRDTIHAAVIQDVNAFEDAIGRFRKGDPTHQAIELTLALVYQLMIDCHRGMPTDQQIHAAAAEIARAESWIQPTEKEASDFLSALMKGELHSGDGASSSIENVIVLSFVCAASLLASCRRDGEEWWQYLDRAEVELENPP